MIIRSTVKIQSEETGNGHNVFSLDKFVAGKIKCRGRYLKFSRTFFKSQSADVGRKSTLDPTWLVLSSCLLPNEISVVA